MTTLALILCTLAPFAAFVWTGHANAAGKVDFLGADKKRDTWHWYRTSGAECVGSHEGHWTSAGYYDGRFQMDDNFQKGYGKIAWKRVSFVRRYGSANHWPKVLQVLAAKHGHNARGWYPWPTTARICGLL